MVSSKKEAILQKSDFGNATGNRIGIITCKDTGRFEVPLNT
jgi:hypothetical protein